MLHTCGKSDHTIRPTEGPSVIDVSSELTETLRESHQASRRLLAAAKTGDSPTMRAAMKDCLAAWHRQRAVWLAMATPVRSSNE
jgi:hypothetical protein